MGEKWRESGEREIWRKDGVERKRERTKGGETEGVRERKIERAGERGRE